MARKRMIDPEYWSDEKVALLPFSARLLFIGIWNFADDDGIFKCRPEFLKNNIYPYDKIELSEIEKDLVELEDKNFIFTYPINGQKFAIVLNFRKHQVINKPLPSKFPHPSIQNVKYQNAIFKRDNWLCHLCDAFLQDKYVEKDGLDGTASIDHIIPKSQGGGDLPNNLKTACLKCNKGRGNRPIDDYRSSTVGRTSKGNEMKSNTNEINREFSNENFKDIKSMKPNCIK